MCKFTKTCFGLIGWKKISLVFSSSSSFFFFLFFLILGNTKKTGSQKVCKAFQTTYIFGSQQAQLQREGAVMLMMPSLNWACVWAEGAAPRSPLLPQSSMGRQCGLTPHREVAAYCEHKSRMMAFDEPASLNCIFSHSVHHSHGKILQPDYSADGRLHLSSGDATPLNESFNYTVYLFSSGRCGFEMSFRESKPEPVIT